MVPVAGEGGLDFFVMNVTVVGNVNYDIITTPDGKTRSGYGGILYNTMILQALLPPPSEITPVAPLGRDNLADLRRLLDSSTAVSLDGFYHHSPGVNRCYLEYQSTDRRLERLRKNTNPIPFSRIDIEGCKPSLCHGYRTYL